VSKPVEVLSARLPPSTRRTVQRMRHAARRPTSGLRVLPDFLVIGGQRCGTDSLFKDLGLHPCVVPATRKEVSYFTRHFAMGEAWYRTHFPTRARLAVRRRRVHARVASFEATPDYLFHPLAPERAAHLVPDAKLVALLRDPLARAYSHYRHMVRLGFEDLSFDEAIAREEERTAPDRARLRDDPLGHPAQLLRYSYAARGAYAEQLERWFTHFRRDRVLVVRSEDFFHRPARTFGEILEFLELPAWQPGAFPNYSRPQPGTGERGPSDAAKADLARYFAPRNEQLSALLGRDMAWGE